METQVCAYKQTDVNKARHCVLRGIPALFLIGALFHFLYALLGSRYWVGLFAPVNESVFEHMKMTPLPTLLWWSACYARQRKCLPPNAWFTGALAAMTTSALGIPLLFYFYTGAFGAELLAVDVLILLASIALGQIAGLHLYRHGEGIDSRIALALAVGLILVFALLTVAPPRLPLFLSPENQAYGM